MLRFPGSKLHINNHIFRWTGRMKIPTFVSRLTSIMKWKDSFSLVWLVRWWLVALHKWSGCRQNRIQVQWGSKHYFNGPCLCRDQANIWATHQVFDGLVQLGKHLEIMPCIAKSWIFQRMAGNIYFIWERMSFSMTVGISGWNGRRVVAADVVYSFSRIIDPKVTSPGAWIFNYVKKTGIGSALMLLMIRLSSFAWISRSRFPWDPDNHILLGHSAWSHR